MKERQDTLQIAQEYSKAHRRKTLWYRAVTCLAAVVVFCTTYALILPAITLEKKCEIPEHTHTDACYTQVTTREKRNPICAVKADVVVHRHDSACYDAEGNLWCTLPEVEAHRHTDACYIQPEAHTHTDACYTQEQGNLICTKSTEPAHVHSDDCYTETTEQVCTEEPAHTHTDACYEWNKVLACGKSTTPGAPELACGKQEVILHTHEPYVSEENPGCYDTDGKTLVCGKPQVVEHQHTAACFETVTESVDTETQTCTNTDPDHVHTARCYGTWKRTCGMEEHTHTLACYSDANADVETAADWEQTFAGVELTGDWPQDVIAIAQTQLGYTESTKNYIVLPDGETMKGYTRYGDWYGQSIDDPNAMYGDWDAMFVSFCLHYAGVDEEFPLKADSASWVQALSDEEYDLYIPAPESDPRPGDLIFFNREQEENAEPSADHAGLVVEVIPAAENTPAQIKVIEGDSSAGDGSPDAVRCVAYELNDETILGYAVIPANLGEEAAHLSAGGIPDTLYLNIGSIGWGNDGAHIVLAYKSTDNNGEWKFAEMTGESTNIYRITLPENMDKTNSAFKFVRMDSSGYFDWDTHKRNEAPTGSGNDLTLQQNKNCFKLTGWDAGQWEDSWYTPAGGTVTTLYLDLTQFTDNGGGWDKEDAIFFLKYQTSSGENKVQLRKQENETYYSVTIPADMDTSKSFRFQRRSPTNNEEVWNFTSDLTLPTNGSNRYIITGWNESGRWAEPETGETRTVYYDATLSKLSYNADGSTNTIPMANGNSEGDKVYCHWWNSASEGNVQMTQDHDDVYRADIPTDAVKVLFYSSSDGKVPDAGSNMTIDLEIPATPESPCFYGDTSDSAIYDKVKRKGYWGEVDTIRDAEAGKNTTVVDIAGGTQTKSNDVLYVNTTLYDYYTDYELNGNNRDNYAKDGVDWNSHRIYQPFRQFNQALSAYYQQNSAPNPLYWGNFQNYRGDNSHHFDEISGTLNLYGYNDKNKFFAENNSMWGYDGNNVGNDGKQATQRLVDSTLSGGTLTMGGNAVPFFSESFLSGSNAKNTVLGKVYHNVSFPFVKQDIKGNGVDYWCFDSSRTDMANSNLQLRQEGSSYFLQHTNSVVNGCATDKTAGPGYFPFNTSEQSAKATQLNYGFGQRFDIKFRLTEDGTVTSSNGAVPVEFNFSGDDDVWVFVDGQLVLDIGGDHGRVDGTINFKERKSTVSRVKNSGSGTTAPMSAGFPQALQGSDFYRSEHTLTMFYMERGLWESNMKITFNFPDENLLAVEKQVDTSSVNSLFQSLFNNKDLFTFNIKTLATHFGTQAASGETSQPVQISLNGSLSTGSSSITFDHTAEHGDVQQGTSEFIRWRCRGVDDNEGTHRSQRYGQLALTTPVSLSGQQYLQFDFWYNWNETPSLSKLFVDLRDASGNPLTTQYLSVSSCISGSPVMAQDQWITLKLDLDRMGVNRSGTVASIRIGYDLGRNVYIRNMSFQPVTTVQSSQVGFVTPQNSIPDYGTASTGALAIPVNAIYTSSRGQSYRIGTDGTFTLRNGETVTFHDQFRRGSYMYLSEDTNPLYTTTWSMYEGMNQNPVANSTVPGGAETVTGGGQGMTGVESSVVTDGRLEVKKLVQGESVKEDNTYLNTDIGAPDDTFVFRHYSNPDNTTTTTKLTVKFTNTVKTGSLTIAKAQADGSENLGTQEFTFYVEFHNVGGMGLEGSSSILAGPYTIPVGGSQTITGIPVGTEFTIHEVKPGDTGIVLDHVNNDIRPGTGTVNDSETYTVTYTVTGSIPADGTAQSYTFYNSKKSVVSLTVRKDWISMQGNVMPQNLPTSIHVQLQRRADGTDWEPVPGYNNVTLAPGYTPWGEYSYTFRDLDRYVSGTTTEYEYRVVELNSDGSVVGEDVMLDGRKFTVTYSKVVNTAEDGAPPAYSQTITNTEQPTGYELPNTGGAGIYPYTIGGMLLITSAAILLLYSHTKRRKEDAVSS